MDLFLHHLVTIFLYGFSYMTNTMVGPVIAYLHDIADIGVGWTRTFAESEFPNVAGYSFAVTVAAWFYTRLIVFPHIIYVVTMHQEVYMKSPYVIPIFGVLLSCLVLLHFYWWVLCMRILISFIKTGKSEDTIS